MINPIVKCKIVKLILKNKRECLDDLETGKYFLNKTYKNKYKEINMINWATLEVKTHLKNSTEKNKKKQKTKNSIE